jgi:eukaryotic-like serine/threonine-protein kinase
MSPSLATNPSSQSAALRAAEAGIDQPTEFAQQPSGASLAPNSIGSWQLDSIIAEGSLARIYRARPTAANGSPAASYVLKVLREQWHGEPVAIARLQQEAHTSRCVSHRHLAPILSAHVHKSPYFVVLPWLNGASVAALLAVRNKLEAPLALWIARQAAHALEALHVAGYVHGDVNPRNLFFGADGHVTLLDLSCSSRIERDQSAADLDPAAPAIAGIPKYLAPEVFVGRQADPRSDIYSLGLSLYAMLAGRLPPAPDDLADLAEYKRTAKLPNVRYFAPEVPVEVAILLQELTACDPLRRPNSARDVANRLMRLEIATLRRRVPA